MKIKGLLEGNYPNLDKWAWPPKFSALESNTTSTGETNIKIHNSSTSQSFNSS